MEDIYPQGPAAVPDRFARASASYRRHAWLAMIGLALFVLAYGGLAGWFVWIGVRAVAGVLASDFGFERLFAAGCAWFLAAFMLKSLFFVRKGSGSDGIEITRAEQPRLFAFLDRLADEAGAPRPHRVFLSGAVNAAVFYDLSLLNLVFPSRKNLEIGLGLVNVLSLGEFKAVCAHEFGHFAQRSMAVGRWVYTAQQIAAHIVGARGALDKFLDGLSRVDIRIAWVGWLLRTIVWALRALIDSLFRLVLIAQRALGRDMEMQADLVAVSLAGSDALVEALHKMPAADDAWDRTVSFMRNELAGKRITRDAFAIQLCILERVGRMLGVPGYGRTPPRPADAQGHRLFKAELAQPPRMWATHPQSHEREENAKRVYLAAPVDARSAWSLFDAPEALREQVTARLLGQPPEGAEPAEPATSMERLETYFARTYYDRAYRGVYLNRSPVLEVASAAELAEPLGPVGTSELDALYPPSLAVELERLHDLERERALLLAVRDGLYSAQGGLVHFRGRALRRGQLTTAIGEVDADLAAVRGALREHDRRCRSVHRAAARQVGGSWEAHLQGTVAVLHYAEHVLADLRDAQGMLANAVAVATATRKASKKDVTRVLQAADQVYDALEAIYAQAAALDIGPALAGRLQWPDWPAVLGEFKLGRASRAQINPWLHASRSWVDHAANALSALRNAALEQLLESEAAVARQVREGGEPAAAPAAPSAPTGYAIATPDRARARTQRLDWWKRFQNAQGFLPGFARTALACLVVGGVLGAGWSVGKVEVFAYNGLSLPVHVDIDGQTLDLAPHASGSLSLDSVAHHAIRTSDMHGHLIEAFEADANNYARTVYNVAGASPLVQWTAIYGGSVDHSNNWHLGNPRWTTTHAVDIFRDPPRSVRTQGGPATREVLTAPAITPDQGLLELLDDGSQRTALIATHARWDAPHSPDLLTWLELASTQPGYRALIDARLANDPDDVPALRARQDAAGADREAVCGRDRARAAAAPDQADLAYVAARCNDDETARNTAFDVGHARWPANAWFAYASAYTAAEHGRWQQALQAMQQADRGEPALRGYLALDIARIRRLVAANPQADLADLLPRSPRLRAFVGLERDTDVGDAMRGYVALARGQLDQALALTPRISDQARMLRLVAASDGASVEAVQRALALPDDQGIDGDSVWTALALDMREGRGAHAFDATLDKFRATPDGTRMVDAMLAFMRLAEQGDTERAQASLVGLPPQARGQAYAAGTVLLGRRTPAAWRMGARCLLFGAERPYFH